MKKSIKGLLSKLTNIQYTYTLVIAVVLIILAISLFEGTITIPFALTMVGLGVVIALQFTIGFPFFKALFSLIVILYTTSLYTSSVMNISGNIVEPFLLTLASITIFLASTYSKENNQWSLKSRPFWSALLVFILVPVKLTMISQGFSVIVAELVGINITIVYAVLWRYWVSNSKKTRIEYPTIVEERELENFKIVFIEDDLNVEKSIWNDYKSRNALPYIYNEVIKAHDNKKNLVLVSKYSSNKLFDMRSIKINRSKEIEYIYLQDKDGKYLDSALDNFKKELELKKN